MNCTEHQNYIDYDAHQDILTEHRELKQRLNRLLLDARKNENTFRRFQGVELQLLGCRSLPELIQMLIHHGHATMGWDYFSVYLHDVDYEISQSLNQMGVQPDDRQVLILTNEINRLSELFAGSSLPSLGPYDETIHDSLFPNKDKALVSVAILPLARGDRLMGYLNLGSTDKNRFQQGAATDFLEHLAAVIAVCLETSIIQERLKHAGLTDGLTGVNNRRYFDQRLIEEVARSLRTRQKLSCLFIDIDYFKKINDTYGHTFGDLVLQGVAKLIRGQLRGADVVARYGGEEFAVLLAQSGRDLALEIAERIRRSVEGGRFDSVDGKCADVSVSIGIGTSGLTDVVGNPIELGERLVNMADDALYRAKREGRNRVVGATSR
jgi:diguanylate cyclase (GGDEF)-like protein